MKYEYGQTVYYLEHHHIRKGTVGHCITINSQHGKPGDLIPFHMKLDSGRLFTNKQTLNQIGTYYEVNYDLYGEEELFASEEDLIQSLSNTLGLHIVFDSD